MGKLIFWLVVVFAAMFVLRLVNVAKHGADRRRSAPRDGAKPAAMIRCADCGVFLPGTDAVKSARGPVCGDAQCARRRRAAAP
ncbi:MAG: hypothetical protein KGL70_06100 [Betaproteobacteria bacterium]|nr:hypothetical protein [Betaproteobacteria bacterium]MDE2002805.1 hypothetical protein [Betaproteobacteria bacterium]MDE2209239.1 hypothetical protein [Betaproteobacteria bacterium]MDE2358942.1 hypothetical protein [Betaproteobacteria bacterium]